MKKSFLPLIVLLMAALFSGCSNASIQDVPEIRAGVDNFISAILVDDPEEAFEVLHNDIKRTEFDAAYTQIYNCIKDVETYELTPIHYNFANRNGTKTIQLTYRMTTNSGAFIVTAAMIEGNEGLRAFNIVQEEQTALSYTGTPGHMQGANLLQWVVLVVGILTVVFVLGVFVDCCRTKIKRKILWLIFILLGGLILSLSMSNGMLNFHFNIGLYMKLSTLMYYGDGSVQLSLVIPLGAIIYLCSKKNLTAKALEVKEITENSAEVTEMDENISKIVETNAIEE